MKRFAPLLAFGMLMWMLFNVLFSQQGLLATPETDRPLPAFSLAAITGDAEKISDATLTEKITLVHFFASWCGVCEAENANLVKLAKLNVAPIYGIVWKDTRDTMKKWLDSHDNPYHAIAIDETGSTAIAFGLRGVPETFVVDGKGKIRYHKIGFMDGEEIEQRLLPFIESLRKGGS